MKNRIALTVFCSDTIDVIPKREKYRGMSVQGKRHCKLAPYAAMVVEMRFRLTITIAKSKNDGGGNAFLP